MTWKSFTSLKAGDFLLIGAATLFLGWVYAGFFFPGIYVQSYGVMARRVLWLIRVALPLAYAGLLLLYLKVRLQEVERGSALLLIIASFAGLFITYQVADVLYQGWFDSHKRQFHPYLQLMPAEYKPRPGPAPGKIMIFCLGGSTTEWPDSRGEDWPSRIESILHQKYGLAGVEVHNLGKEWYTSLHSLINYETNLRRFRPSVILIMQSINDLLQNADFSYFSHDGFRQDYGHFYGPVNRIIDRRSLWRYLRDVVSDSWYARPRQAVTTDVFPGLETYKRNIRTIIELAKHDSTRVVLMAEPCLFKPEMSPEELSAVGMLKVEAINDSLVWSPQTVLSGMRQYNAALQEIAEQEGIPYVDLASAVPKTLTFFRDEVHYRDTTYSIIAPLVAERLQALLRVEGPPHGHP